MNSPENTNRKNFASKYPVVVAKRGFVPMPKCIFTCPAELGLKSQEVLVLGNIIEKCWFPGEKSWKKVDTIAADIGSSNSTIRSITKSLTKKRFINKTQRYNASSLYDPSPTAERIADHLAHCKYQNARKLTTDSLKSDGLYSQKSSDYLEPEFRTTNIKYGKTQNNIPNKECEIKFLELINHCTHRNLRILPKEAKETLKSFSLEEIEIALQNLAVDTWHKDRLNELPISYLTRASTIDNLLNRDLSKEAKRKKKLQELYEMDLAKEKMAERQGAEL